MRRLALFLAVAFALLPQAGRAERLVSALSNQSVAISSSFAGERLTISGNIEPDLGADQRDLEGPYQVLIVVTGPVADRVARLKTNRFGIWMNTEEAVFRRFPSYYQVLASGKLAEIATPEALASERILPEAQAKAAATPGGADPARFGRELIRLMNERQLFGVDEAGVDFQSETFYSARLTLPSDVPNGPFLAKTYLLRNGEIIATRSDGFSVSQIGFERFLANSSRRQPLLYGLTCVLLAVFTGWLGGVVFKR